MLWKVEGIQPISVQRLANGNTFIPCNGLLVEVDRAGKDILRVPVSGMIVAAHRLPDRRIIAFDRQYIIHLDAAGRPIKQISVMTGGGGNNELLDNGHLLSLSPGFGDITEFDMEGKEVGRFAQPGALHGFRLPNGHTLVLVQGTKYIELDEKWKPLKETMLATPAFRVKRR